MGPHVFSVDRANALIPELDRIFADLDAVRQKLLSAKKKMDVLEMIHGESIMSMESPDRREYEHYDSEVAQLKSEFERACGRIGELGGHLKSVDQGLVDFCGVIDERLVELCWKRGESRIEYFHHVGEGFGGRQAIPAEV
jgi:hypothetical protein